VVSVPVVSAAAALDARQRDPRAAAEVGRRALALARARGDAEEASAAQRAIGLCLREIQDFDGALRHLRRAVSTAERAGSRRYAALARMSLAFVLSNTGRHGRALREVNAAVPVLHGVDAGHARMQRGVVLHYLCRYEEALREYNHAIEVVRRFGDRLVEARALNNRGLLRAYCGGLRAADDDFARAAEIYSGLGLELARADVVWNAGISATRAGDVPRALTLFAEADEEYRRLDVPRSALLVNRLELLVSVPLLEEAGAAVERALVDLRGPAQVLARSEALFHGARVALATGDLDLAASRAAQARGGFRREGRGVWEASARHVELRAAYLSGRRDARLCTALIGVADRLDALGWPVPAVEARVDAALVAVALGATRRAARQLETAARFRRGGPAAQRARGWYAEGLRRRLAGDVRGSQRALRRGLVLLDEHRASLGASELRALSGAHGKALAEEGLRAAVAAGRPSEVLIWAESWRAGALRMTPVRPPEDPRLADALAELRVVAADLETALTGGRATGSLRQRQLRLEQRVLELTRRVSGDGGAVSRPPAVRALAGELGDGALVEFVTSDDELLAVVVAAGRATLHRLGGVAGVDRELRMLRFAVQRLVTLPGDVPGRASVRASAEHAAGLLDARLLAPLARRIGDRPLVVVPTAAVNGLPWSVLPSCHGRPVTVAPSATVWLRAELTGEVDTGRPVLAAGPNLPGAPAEIAAIGEHRAGARVLIGADATVEAVAAALDGAPLAHVAAHGSFRTDNPLFSSLELADGPLTVHDLEQRVRTPPSRVVLSACDTGMSAVRPGDELMGFTAALLGLGTRTLVAPVLPVPTEVTTPLVVELHRGLAAGLGPAAALAAAQHAHAASGDDGAFAASAGFVCFGAGGRARA
jgi:tetratricopeptide (TPR) repeat protein